MRMLVCMCVCVCGVVLVCFPVFDFCCLVFNILFLTFIFCVRVSWRYMCIFNSHTHTRSIMKNEKSRSVCQLLLFHSSRFPLSLVRCLLSVSVHKCVCGSTRVEFLCLFRFWLGLGCLCLRFFYILDSFLASFSFFFVFAPLFALFALAQLLLLLVALSSAALGHVASCCDNDNNNSNRNKNNSSWQLLSV